MKLTLGSVSIVLLVIFPANADESWTRITTAEGRGADTTIDIGSGSISHGEQPLLGLHQNMPATDVGQKIYLRFDLSSMANQRIESAHLTLQPVAGYNARYDFNVFGLREAADGSDVAWVESGSGEAMTWANAPGHDPGNPGGGFEINDIQEFEEVEQKQQNGEVKIVKKKAGVRQEVVNNGGMDLEAVTYLGKISIRPGNNRSRLVGDPIVAFLNADHDGMVTVVLTRATAADQPVVFASREHPLFEPPSLWLTSIEQSDPFTGMTELIGFKVPGDPENRTIELLQHKLGIRAYQLGWIDCIEDLENLYATLNSRYAQDDLASTTRLVVSLADLMRTEAAFKGLELLEDEWAEHVAQIVNQHPERADDLIYAFYVLSGTRMIDGPVRALTQLDFRPLLDYDLNPLARQTVMEFVVEVIEGPEEGERLAHYRSLIPVAHGKPTTPYIIHEYAAALEKAEGTDAVLAFLDQTAALKPNEPMGQAASVLRVSHEADPARKSALIAGFVESGEGDIAEAIRPYYLTNQASNGQLLEALNTLDSSLSEKRSANPTTWGRAVVEGVYEVLGGSTRITLFPKMESARLDLGEKAKPSKLCTELAKQLYEEGNYLDSSSISLGLITLQGYALPGLELASSIDTLADLMPDDTTANRQATAALLLNMVFRHQYEEALSRKYLREASSASPTGQTQAQLLLHQALNEAQRGKTEKAEPLLAQALTLVPDSTTLSELQSLVEAAKIP